MKPGKKSRGELTAEASSPPGDSTPEDYLQELTIVDERVELFAGFNLLLGERRGRFCGSRRIVIMVFVVNIRSREYTASSNGAFDEPWPKLSSGKQELAAMLDGEIIAADLMEILTDHQVAEDHELPQTGVSLDIERMLSSRFIRSPEYGTRACSVVTIGANKQISFSEQNYLDAGHSGNLIQESFEITT